VGWSRSHDSILCYLWVACSDGPKIFLYGL